MPLDQAGLGFALPRNDERHVDGLLVEGHFLIPLVGGVSVAVVGGVDDHGVLEQSLRLQFVDHQLDVGVHHFQQAVVTPHVLAPLGLGPVLRRVLGVHPLAGFGAKASDATK